MAATVQLSTYEVRTTWVPISFPNTRAVPDRDPPLPRHDRHDLPPPHGLLPRPGAARILVVYDDCDDDYGEYPDHDYRFPRALDWDPVVCCTRQGMKKMSE